MPFSRSRSPESMIRSVASSPAVVQRADWHRSITSKRWMPPWSTWATVATFLKLGQIPRRNCLSADARSQARPNQKLSREGRKGSPASNRRNAAGQAALQAINYGAEQTAQRQTLGLRGKGALKKVYRKRARKA